jgi:hypothetical protein
VPTIKWEDFLYELSQGEFRWRQGEHVTLIGNTGCGKTTMALNILPIRKYFVAFGTKPVSESLDRMIKQLHMTRISEWPTKTQADKLPRRMLWPPIRNRMERAKLRGILDRAFDAIFYREGSWCVYVDELPELSQTLKLNDWITTYLRQGREIGISFVTAMQRPKFVPLDVYTNSTHLFFWQEKDWSNLERISAISSVDTRIVAEVVTTLDKYEFLYINTRTGDMVRGMTPDPSKGGK